MAKPTWDILICTIPHRYDQVSALLSHLDKQLMPGMLPQVQALVYQDNLENSYGNKCQTLMDHSCADYVCFLDDDDWTSDDYVAQIYAALLHKPDYVGFRVRWTKDGVPMLPVEHSLHWNGWHDLPNVLLRDINQFNPIKRSIARLGTWIGGNGADRTWSDQVRASGHCRSEVWIDKEIHYYQDSAKDTFLTPRRPFAKGTIPKLPRYPWLVDIS
jgi:hypothetical protein